MVESFISMLIEENSKKPSDNFPSGFRQIGNEGFYFNQLMQVEFRKIIHEIARYRQLGLKLSDSYIEKEFDNSLANILSNRENIKIELETLLSRLVSLKFKSRVFLPISGIETKEEIFSLGPYQFIQNPPGWLSPMILSFLDQVKPKEVTGEPIDQKRFVEIIAGNITGKLTLVIDLDCEPSKATQMANNEGKTIINILKLYYNPRYLLHNLSNLYIGGQPLNYIDSILVFDVLNLGVSHKSQLIGAIQPLELTKSTIEKLQKNGIDQLLGLIRTNTKNDFNERLLRSIQWYIEGSFKERQYDQILSQVIALECIMKPRNTMGIKDSMLENVALLIGNNLEERKNIMKELKDLIDLRNEVSHGSKSKEITDDKLDRINGLVRSVIFRLIDFIGKMNSMDDLHTELTNKRLSVK